MFKLLSSKYYGNHNHHSILLNNNFSLNHKGIDFTNDNNVKIEFKESFTNNRNRILLKINDLESDYLAVNINNRVFYIVKVNQLTELHFTTYKAKNGKTILCSRIESNTLIKKSCFRTLNFYEFKLYLIGVKK